MKTKGGLENFVIIDLLDIGDFSVNTNCWYNETEKSYKSN